MAGTEHPQSAAPQPARQPWPQASLEAWRTAASAEIEGGDVDELARTIDDGVTMLPLFTRQDLPAHAAGAPWKGRAAMRLAATCTHLPDEGRLPEADGFDVVRLSDPVLRAELVGAEPPADRVVAARGRLRHVDPARAVLAVPYGELAAVLALHRAGLRHDVLLEVPVANGAGPAHELATTLATACAALSELAAGTGASVADLARRLHVPVLVGTDVVAGVAKLRAARWLGGALLRAFDVPDTGAGLRWWAQANPACWSAIDPELNLVRSALQAFVAVTGGAEVFEPMLFDPAQAPAGSLRLAANQLRLLLHESNLRPDLDPGAGSFAIEALTARIAEAAWALLQARAGSATPADALASTAAAARILVGTHRYADPTARITEPLPQAGRPAAPFEQLRLRTAGRGLDLLLVPFGDRSAARPRIAWAAELLRTAGIEPRQASACADAAALRAQLVPPPRAVVLCGLDDPSGTFVRAALAACRDLAPRPLVYATGEPPAGSETWGAVGFLHRGLDAASTLEGILDRLEVPHTGKG